MPEIDRWNKRFFLCYFIVLMLCSFSAFAELFLYFNPVSLEAVITAMIIDSLMLSLPLPMLTAYLLHCLGEKIRLSKLMYVVLGLWALLIILTLSSPFNDTFTYVTPDNQYYRGSLYPILLMPMIMILLLNLAKVIHCRSMLTRKVFFSFIIVLPIMTGALIVNLFFDAMPLFDISVVLSALSMYGLVLSDQVQNSMLHQEEIANQRISIKVLQMRPHFIYNTLMTIYSLCDQDAQKTRQVTMDFTNYLRKNFNAVVSDSAIPFSAELEHTRAYLAVEQARFESLLLVDYDTQFTNFRLPPLTLQPIVENAVKHCMNPYSGPLHISVQTRHADNGAEIIIKDNGSGFDPTEGSEPHITLTNIRQRLEMMSGGSLIIKPGDNGGTVVTITIPDRATQYVR